MGRFMTHSRHSNQLGQPYRGPNTVRQPGSFQQWPYLVDTADGHLPGAVV